MGKTNMNSNPTLSIKDIVLIKENPAEFFNKQITKNHGGLEIAKDARYGIYDFTKLHHNSWRNHAHLMNNKGEIISIQRDSKKPVEVDYTETGENDKNLHVMYTELGRNVGNFMEGDPYHRQDNGFGTNDVEKDIYRKNENGDYMVRSVTQALTDGTAVTVSRHNDFTDKNIEDYEYARECLRTVSDDYQGLITQYVNDRVNDMSNGYFAGNEQPPDPSDFQDFHNIAKEEAIKEFGDYKTFVNNAKVDGKPVSEIFAKAKCKLTIRQLGDNGFNDDMLPQGWESGYDYSENDIKYGLP